MQDFAYKISNIFLGYTPYPLVGGGASAPTPTRPSAVINWAAALPTHYFPLKTCSVRNCVHMLQVLPVSSAACERIQSNESSSYSGQKPYCSYYLSDLLMISINGHCLRDWNVDKYVNFIVVESRAIWRFEQACGQIK